jgi:hypothetical protein
MPVLEAMACGIPAILTEGGPTDEFCPPEAGWRIRASRSEFSAERVGSFDTVGRPWVLEPDPGHLAQLLMQVAENPAELTGRGALARAAAESHSWRAIAERYDQRILALASRPPVCSIEARDFEEDVALRVLATPAWRGQDRLSDLLTGWSSATDPNTSACLYLLADPRVDGTPEELEARVLASGVELENAGDVTVLLESISSDDGRRLHAGVDAYIPIHGACQGHLRMALSAGNTILSPERQSLTDYISRPLASPAPA